jgi:hypothetical protein
MTRMRRTVVDWTSGQPVERPYQVRPDRDGQLAIVDRLDRILADDRWPTGMPLTPRERELLRGNVAAVRRLLATSSPT